MIYLVIYLVTVLGAVYMMFGRVVKDENEYYWNDFVEYTLRGLVFNGSSGLSDCSDDEVNVYDAARQVMFVLAIFWPILLIMFGVSWLVIGMKKKV